MLFLGSSPPLAFFFFFPKLLADILLRSTFFSSPAGDLSRYTSIFGDVVHGMWPSDSKYADVNCCRRVQEQYDSWPLCLPIRRPSFISSWFAK